MSSFDSLSKLKRMFLFLFLGATTLTFVTNYFNFRSNVLTELQRSASMQGSPWLLYRVNKNTHFNGNNESSLNESQLIEAVKTNLTSPWPNCTNVTIDNAIWGGLVRKTYTILTNFVRAEHETSCEDFLITLTTHGDYRYLDNLVPVVERWQGPLSIALYVPHDDLDPTLHRIAYMRDCTSPLIKEWVSFHLYAETRYFRLHAQAGKIWKTDWGSLNQVTLCGTVPEFDGSIDSSRKANRLYYPVNIARNVARQAATTRYIFASDIELYPSVDFIPKFFDMLQRRYNYFQNRPNPFVFVFPIFEMEKDYDLPDTKEQLIELIDGNFSVTFHKYVCPECHKIPNYESWLVGNNSGSEDEPLNIFSIAKRQTPFTSWEPIYVSTNDVPLYDERLSWEGLRDKMSQSYTMCLLDYDFMILDNAFLMHKPGIKRKGHDMKKPKGPIKKQNRVLRRIHKQISIKYGKREGCLPW